jgi:murein DD-endopeptidase MepM/ murein hydrolase activator NlpD
MLSNYKNGLINDLTGQNAKWGFSGGNIFRLAAVLCLAFSLAPVRFNQQQPSLEAAEHGIGGGVFLDDEFYESDLEDILVPSSHAAVDSDTANLESGSLFKARTLLYSYHVMQRGDNISQLAMTYGLRQDSIISTNKINNSRSLPTGRLLKIPNQDGILHTVRSGESLTAIAARYNADKEAIKIVNELFSDKVVGGTDLFIPGAQLDRIRLQEINGDLFVWPVHGAITSFYGNRRDPFNPSRWHFHNGIDIRARTGTPVRAAMAGRVSSVGYDHILGNYVMISHHSGYRTLYGHLSVIRTRTGAYVVQGERIGDVGNTGRSTGPHVHFTVYRNGSTVNPRNLLR